MLSLATVNKYRDYTDDFWKAEYTYLADAEVEIRSSLSAYNRTIVDGAFSYEYREWVGEHSFTSLETPLELDAPEVAAYKQERTSWAPTKTKCSTN